MELQIVQNLTESVFFFYLVYQNTYSIYFTNIIISKQQSRKLS